MTSHEVMWRVRSLASTQDGVLTASQCLQLGMRNFEIEGLCRSGHWLRLARGVYFTDAGIHDELPERSRIRGALSAFGPSAVCVAGTAAHLHDMAGVPTQEAIELSVPSVAVRSRQFFASDVVLHQWPLKPDEVTRVRGFPATTVMRTVADLVLRLDRLEAVSVLDSVLNRALLPDLAGIPALFAHRPGAAAARGYLAEADGRAQSPLESRTRLRCVDAGLPPGDLQYPVRDQAGTLLGYADLAWREPRVIAEADGIDPHSQPQALLRDRRRQNDFVNEGWTVLRFTWQDTLRAGYIPSMVRRALTRGSSPR